MNGRRVLCISQEKLKIIKPPRLLLHEKIPNRYNFILELLQHYQIYFLPKINCYKKSVLDLIRAYFYCIKLVYMYNWNYTQVQKRKPPYPLQNSLFIYSINPNFGFQNIFNYTRQLSMSKINKSTNS